ncbi:hypothetical protein QA601_01920 [Chitinispirillales bacterium ANBcel5]|uniref:hypothetical protein n=1 Tax=Cellulosispirillum alkaliphilum TaxID=3039283 RepID=UPI002A57CFB8|nr:hypothetical protein [Chitinispirillales bacterium ANBcel5]
MIRINLQKNSGRKKPSVLKAGTKVVLPVALFAVLAIAVIGAVTIFQSHTDGETEKELLSSGVKPSTRYRPDMVEDVVRDVDSTPDERIPLRVPYEKMSVAEKIKYEVLFAKRVIEVIDRVMSPEINLVSLEIDSFQTFYALGFASSRDAIGATFNSLKQERLELLPPPLSYIKSDGENGYRFVVTCQATFGLGEADPFKVLDNLPYREGLNTLIRQFSSLASQNGVNLRSSLNQISSEKIGRYRRILYRVEGDATYREFVRFILALNKEEVPGAFEKIKIAALGGDRISVNLDVLFTIKE